MLITVLILFGLLGLLLVLNVPLVVALGLPTMLAMFYNGYSLETFVQQSYVAASSFPLLAIPFFMFAGKIMEEGGLSERIVRFANSLVGWLPGGLNHVLIVASAFFGALCGSAPATTAAIGSIMIPEMRRRGYSAASAAGLQAVAGTLGTIIPPSIPMIVYGVVTGTSIGDLFIAGVGPGILLAALLMITSVFRTSRENQQTREPFSLQEVGKSFTVSIGALLVPVIVLGGIYGGLFTPTEAGAVAVFYAAFAATIFYRGLNRRKVNSIVVGSVVNTILVMAIVAFSGAFSWLLTIEGIAKASSEFLLGHAESKIVFLLIINILFLIVGTFMETIPAILIFAPLITPAAKAFGIDPVHLGTIIVVNISLGMATPPVGVNLFVAASVSKENVFKVIQGSLPYLLAMITGLMLITYWPALSLTLPGMMR